MRECSHQRSRFGLNIHALAAVVFLVWCPDRAAAAITLNQVRSYVYAIVAGPNTPGINTAIANSSADMMLLGGGDPSARLNRQAADPNNNKLIIGYIETTEASSYAEPELFRNGARSPILGAAIQGYTDLFSVRYWDPVWEREVFRQVDALIASGYDGIFLDSLEYTDWTEGNIRGNPVYADAAPALAALLSNIRSYIRSKNVGRPFYLIGNDPISLAEQYPEVLSYLDALFQEWVYWGQPLSDGLTSEYKGTSVARFLKDRVANLYKGRVVFANDYPNPLTNLSAAFDSFAFYSALGWVPSVTKAFQTIEILSTGPFMFLATPENSSVTGASNFVNFISGGTASSANLTGGNRGDYFIGGPGQNTINGGAGNDTIYAHPAAAGLKNVLNITVIADIRSVTAPSITVRVNGTVAYGPTTVTADFQNNEVHEIRVNVSSFGPLESIEISGAGIQYVDSTHYSNLQLQTMTFNNQAVSFNQAQYNPGSNALSNGARAIIASNTGKIVFSASALPAASVSFLANTSDTINGGGGINTVIYRGRSNDYTVMPQGDGSFVIRTTATAEGPDTLSNVQFLQFSDKTIAVSAVTTLNGTPFAISNLGAASLASTGAGSKVVTGYARIQPITAGSAPSGVAIFNYKQDNVIVSEVGVPATSVISSGRIHVDISADVNTGLAIANPNSSTANLAFYFTDTNGNAAGSGTVTIPPNQQIAQFLDQSPFKVYPASTFLGTFTFTSTVPVAAVPLRGFTNERGDFLMSTLPVVSTSASSSVGISVMPHFADGGGWSTQIMLVNPTDIPMTGNVHFWNPAGTTATVTIGAVNNTTFSYSIPGRSSQKLLTSGSGASTTSGSIRIVPTESGPGPIPLVMFSYRTAGITVSQAGLTVTTGTAFRTYAESSFAENIESGIAVANLSSASTTVTFSLSDLNGAPIAGSLPVTVPLSGNGQTAKFLGDIFPGLPRPFKGVLRITTPSSGISVVGLRSRINERGDFLITTTPPTSENSAGATSAIFFPHLADGSGYATQFILFSGTLNQSTSGNLYFFNQDGSGLNLTLN